MARLARGTRGRLSQEKERQDLSERVWPDELGRTCADHNHTVFRFRKWPVWSPLREGAILQSFPKKYKFTAPGEPISKKVLGRLIGNAVPVKLGELIGKSILKHVTEYNASVCEV